MVDGMDDMQIREFALFLYEENQKKSKQLDDMIARLDEIGKDLKEARKELKESRMQIENQSETIKKTEKTMFEYKMLLKEHKKLEKKYNDLLDRMALANAQTYSSSKSQKDIDKKKSVKGKHDDRGE